MTLIKSISGIRGTIGGPAGDTLNPLDIVKFTSAYATLIRRAGKTQNNRIVVGRDARISGEMVKNVVCGTLMGMGFDVVNIGLATTPTTELAVRWLEADGGIIITASHNPRQWNALKLLNCEGEFLNKAEGEEVLRIAAAEDFLYADVDHMGHYCEDNTMDRRHIESVLALELVDAEAVRKAGFRVVVDSINSTLGQLDDVLDIESVMVIVGHIENDDPVGMVRGIYDKYKVGRNDRGLVIVVGYLDHSYFIAPGRSLEGDLTDYECNHLAQDYLIPSMKAEQPDSGMLYLARGIYALMADKDMPQMSSLTSGISDEGKDAMGSFAAIAMLFFLWAAFTYFMGRKVGTTLGIASLMGNPFVTFNNSRGFGGHGGSSSGWGGGGFSGGHSGGFGGGSWGGGGAGGRW